MSGRVMSKNSCVFEISLLADWWVSTAGLPLSGSLSLQKASDVLGPSREMDCGLLGES